MLITHETEVFINLKKVKRSFLNFKESINLTYLQDFLMIIVIKRSCIFYAC